MYLVTTTLLVNGVWFILNTLRNLDLRIIVKKLLTIVTDKIPHMLHRPVPSETFQNVCVKPRGYTQRPEESPE